MSDLILYYSYNGYSKKLALEAAAKSDGKVFEVLDKARPSSFKAYTLGCFKALSLKGWPIQNFPPDLSEQKAIDIYSPVWAGYPAPAINSILHSISSGQEINLFMVSASGKSNAKEKVQALLQSRGARLLHYENIKKSES